MSQILSQNPSYTATLYATYFSGVTSSSEPLFTRAEKNYIYSCGPIKIGLFTDQVPYCYTDSNGDFQGLIPYVLLEISKKAVYILSFVQWIPRFPLNNFKLPLFLF